MLLNAVNFKSVMDMYVCDAKGLTTHLAKNLLHHAYYVAVR